MACSFSVPFSGEPDEILTKAKAAVLGGGGTFTGNDRNGQFEVWAMGNSVAGTYTVAAGALQIEITAKPFFLPCSTIESYLKNQLT